MRADDGTRHDRAMTRTDTPPPPVRDTAGEDARPLDSEEVDSSEWSIWAGWEAAARAGAVGAGADPATGAPRSAAARRATGGTPVAARAGGTTPPGNRRA